VRDCFCWRWGSRARKLYEIGWPRKWGWLKLPPRILAYYLGEIQAPKPALCRLSHHLTATNRLSSFFCSHSGSLPYSGIYLQISPSFLPRLPLVHNIWVFSRFQNLSDFDQVRRNDEICQSLWCRLDARLFASFGKITSASREEETCSQTALIVKSLGDRTSDSELADTGHIIQSKDAFVARIIGPRYKLYEKINSGIGEALRFILTRAGVKGSISSIR
jgi:hypothetical protein